MKAVCYFAFWISEFDCFFRVLNLMTDGFVLGSHRGKCSSEKPLLLLPFDRFMSNSVYCSCF